MSTGYGREGIRQVCATLLVHAMYLSASAVAVCYLGRYIKCSTFFSTDSGVDSSSRFSFYCADRQTHSHRHNWSSYMRRRRGKVQGLHVYNTLIH